MARILLVTNDFPPDRGGIQTYLRELVARTSHDVRVIAPANEAAELAPSVVRHPRWRFFLPTPRVRRWVLGQVASWNPDVVVFGAPHPPALLGPSIARRSGLPYAVLCHGAETLVAAAIPGLRQVFRRSLRRAATVMAVSEFTAGRVRRLTGGSCQRLGVGVEPVEEGSRDPQAADVICVGRLVPRKGQHILIDAVARLEDWPGRLLLVGAGRKESSLRRRAQRRDVGLTIEKDLTDDEVAARLRGAAVFAQPCRSRWFGLEVEGLGISFLEAAAAGLPVVAGRSGGAPETVIPGRSGFLAGSAVEVEEALRMLLADPDLRRVMGESGRRHVADAYAWPDVVGRFDDIIDAVSSGAGPSSLA